MSNPYRARPGRPRTDSSLSNYGMHNQNWMSQPRPPVPDQSSYAQPSSLNQPKQNDSWDWGTDALNNGNDSWNWNVDQPESQAPLQQPQAPLQSQPPQYRQPYLSQTQTHQPVYPAQDNYYKNVNGNNQYRPPTVQPNEYQQFPSYYEQQAPPQPNPPRETFTPKPEVPFQNTNYNWNSNEGQWPNEKQLWVKQPRQLNEDLNQPFEHQNSFSNQQSFPSNPSAQSWHQPETWPEEPVANVEAPEEQAKPVLPPPVNENPKFGKERQDSTVSESSKDSSNSKSQENAEVDWNADIEWDTVGTGDAAAGLSQMSLNDTKHDVRRVVPGSKVEVQEPEPEPEKNLEVKPTEKSGYDNWYNHWGEDGNQWSTERNVENYENIQQQPNEFMNLEVVAQEPLQRDLYGSRESINKETLDNDPKVPVPKEEFVQEQSNVEVVQTVQQTEQVPENYEFASSDRNTFLETGELTDSHQEHEPTPPSQDDENDEVPSDIPFLREVPGQSSSIDRRNDPTGQEYVQTGARIGRNDPSGQAQLQRTLSSDRIERRDVPSGQERSANVQRSENENLERRNIPQRRDRLPPQQSRNDPSGEERTVVQSQNILEPSETRQVPGRGNEIEESRPADANVRQILGGVSPNDPSVDDRSQARVVTGSQEVLSSVPMSVMQDPPTDSMKRKEAVGASVRENKELQGPPSHRDSYEDGDDEGSVNSRDGSRDRRRESPDRRRYDYERKHYFDRDYEDDYYYDRRRGEFDRSFNSREDLDRRENLFRDDEDRRRHRDELDRHPRDDDRRDRRIKEDEDRDGRRRLDDRRRERPEDIRRDRPEDPRRRDYDLRYPRERDPREREREYVDHDRRRDDRRRRYDDYDTRDSYRRDPYYDDYGRSSRPSSRSSFNGRDGSYYGRTSYAYNGYPYDYPSTYNSNYYAYFENLRRTNPAAYAEWYHKYYANHQAQATARAPSNYPDGRASVHSGQSSCDEQFCPYIRSVSCPSILKHPPNQSLYNPYFYQSVWIRSSSRRRTTVHFDVDSSASDKRNLTDVSGLEDQTVASSRLTPNKFASSHVIGSFSVGTLVYSYPSYPTDGERARIDIFKIDNVLQQDALTRELKTYPGPLIKQVGVTHKKTIIEYCETKIKRATSNEDVVDQASYILLYEFMIMMIQQNGNVVGVDIATLLLKNKEAYPYEVLKGPRHSSRRESTISQRSAASGGEGTVPEIPLVHEKVDNVKPHKSIEEITDQFRKTLLYGLVQEALEYAMEENLWGHALFLASKLDKRTHASVMTRFANSLPTQDPLQTLYQLHSGRVPASVTCVADHKWDDWRPHLAMIISNTSANPDVNRRSITILGDTLASRGDIHAAHFCYILAQVDFSSYDSRDAKLVLIGANHHRPYNEFVTNEAVMLTEIYEYARSLSEPGFTLVDLQSFKFNMAVKMADHGLLEKALLYIEQVAVNIAKEPSKYSRKFINDVYNLGDRIKYHDPICKDSVEDAANLAWLNNLAEVVSKCQTGEIIQESIHAATSETKTYSNAETVDLQTQQSMGMTQDYQDGPSSLMEMTGMVSQIWQPQSLPGTLPDQYNQGNNFQNQEQSQYQPLDYWQTQQGYLPQEYGVQDYAQPDWQTQNNQQFGANQPDVNQHEQQQSWDDESRPTITMAPMGKQYDPLKELDEQDKKYQQEKQSAQETKKPTEKSADKKSANSGSWFGGFLSKLAPKPKNQMILPDDRDPSIVWDPVNNKWKNKEDDGENDSAPLAPPPKVSDMSFGASAAAPPVVTGLPPLPPSKTTSGLPDEPSAVNQSKIISGNNMFKLQKNRSMRANYIDVMNPNSMKNSARPGPITTPPMPMAASSPQLFTPAPVNDPNAPVDYMTPAPAMSTTETTSQGLSRWSSTSSLSREVQSYTMRDPRHFHPNKIPGGMQNKYTAR